MRLVAVSSERQGAEQHDSSELGHQKQKVSEHEADHHKLQLMMRSNQIVDDCCYDNHLLLHDEHGILQVVDWMMLMKIHHH